MTALTPAELERLWTTNLPSIDDHQERVEAITERGLRARFPFKPAHIGVDVWNDTGAPVFSGPMVMGFADKVMYGCLHAHLGRGILGVMVNIGLTFLRPAQATDLIAEARLVRLGKRHAYLEAYLYSDGDDEPIAHATSTHSIVRRASPA